MVPYTTTGSGNRELEPSAWWASGQRSQHEVECNHFRSVPLRRSDKTPIFITLYVFMVGKVD